jgi:hypothetical protein
VKQLDQPLIDIDQVFLAEEQFALLLDEHRVSFILSHLELMLLLQRFGKQADVLLDELVVHLDDRAAEQLVEAEFEAVLFGFTDFQCESHMAGYRNGRAISALEDGSP